MPAVTERPLLAPWARVAVEPHRVALQLRDRAVVLEGAAAEQLLPALLSLLDGVARAVSPYLPTRQWSDLVVGAVGVGTWRPASLAWLTAYAAVFALLARFAYRHDELRHFR